MMPVRIGALMYRVMLNGYAAVIDSELDNLSSGNDLSILDGNSEADPVVSDSASDGVTLSDIHDDLLVTNGLLGLIVALGLFFALYLIGSMLYKLISHNVTKFID